MPNNVDINGGTDCVVAAVGTTDEGEFRKKVVIAGLASGQSIGEAAAQAESK